MLLRSPCRNQVLRRSAGVEQPIGPSGRRRVPPRALLTTALVIGAGLVLVPFVFQMFSRAPMGGDMLAGFRPCMDDETITGFQSDMGQIDVAVTDGPCPAN
jgi:hypothetical protein